MSEDAQGLIVPFRVIELAEVDSTNAEALRRAAAGDLGPVWIRADRQSHGRGRSGRSWQSIDGNLAATLLFSPCCQPSQLYQLALLTGVAAHDAVARQLADTSGAGLRLKWPNDILVGDAKLGGILVESSTFAGRTLAAIGVGINIVAAPDVPERKVASLARLGARPSPELLLSALAEQMENWLRVWQSGAGFSSIRRGWLDRAGPIGEPMTVHTGTATVAGMYAGIDETGALLLQGTDGAHGAVPDQLQRFTFGDVTLTPRVAAKG